MHYNMYLSYGLNVKHRLHISFMLWFCWCRWTESTWNINFLKRYTCPIGTAKKKNRKLSSIYSETFIIVIYSCLFVLDDKIDRRSRSSIWIFGWFHSLFAIPLFKKKLSIILNALAMNKMKSCTPLSVYESDFTI